MIPIQFNSIGFDPILVQLQLISSNSLFSLYTVNYSYSMRLNQCPISISMIYCIIYLFNKGFTNGIIIKYRSIRTIPLCHYQIQSSRLFEATSLLSLLNNPDSILFKPLFGYYWQIAVIIIYEYSINDRCVISNKEHSDFRNEWLIDSNNNPNSVSLQKWQRKQHNQADKTDILIIMESCIGIKNRFETNKQSFHRNVSNQ